MCHEQRTHPADAQHEGQSAMSARLSIDWIACDGRGLCAELAPELIEQDEWGYPLVLGDSVPDDLQKAARRAVRACPTMALRLESSVRNGSTRPASR